MGLAAGGVGGMRLKKGDRVVSAHVVDPGGELVTFTEQGFAKRTGLDQYSGQGRNGGGIVTHKVSSRTGNVAAAYLLGAHSVETLIVLQEKSGVKLVEVEAIPQMGRGVLGKQVLPAPAGNHVIAVRAAGVPLSVDVVAASVIERTVALPEPAAVAVEEETPSSHPPAHASRTVSSAAPAKIAASKPAPASKPPAERGARAAVEAQPELPLEVTPAKPAPKSNGADGQEKPEAKAGSAGEPAPRRSRTVKTDAPAAPPEPVKAAPDAKPPAHTAGDKAAPSQPKTAAQPAKPAAQEVSKARAGKQPPTASSATSPEPTKAKPQPPAAHGKKPPAGKDGKLSTVTTVKKPRPKK